MTFCSCGKNSEDLSKYVYIDGHSCLHTKRNCEKLMTTQYYRIKFCDTAELYNKQIAGYCFDCISDEIYEKLQRNIHRASAKKHVYKITYQITTSDGKLHETDERNIKKYGMASYAADYPGATVRMRDEEGDYDVPLEFYNDALADGLRPFRTEHIQMGEK